MTWLFQPLLMLVARSTANELASQIEFLKAENQMLRRRLGKQVRPTAAEWELLLKLGRAVGAGVAALITIVTYRSYQRRARSARQRISMPVPSRRSPGRPRTSLEVRELVLRLARENAGWGYTRILGELRKLGIKTSRSNVINILRSERIDPKTDPTKGTWAEFIKAHGESLWQCDFFSKHIITPEGVRQCFVLAFVHVVSRRVYLSPCTFHMPESWLVEQAQAFVRYARATGLAAGMVCRDRDSSFIPAFDRALAEAGVGIQRVGFCAPNMNAYIERFVQSIQQECLDKFIAFGREHFDLLNREYVEHYHHERPHQAMENRPLCASDSSPPDGDVVMRERLGGVLRHYARAAAAA